MALLLPVRNDVFSYKFKVDLEGVIYTLQFKYNLRIGIWTMDIMTGDDETPILMGRPLLTDYDSFSRFKTEGLPPGRFVLVDTTGASADPGLKDMGDRHQLSYVGSTEVL